MSVETSLPSAPLNTNTRLAADQLWAMPVQERLVKLNWLGNMWRSDTGIPFLALAVADPFTSLVTSEVSYPGRRIAITYATDRHGGFSDAEIAEIVGGAYIISEAMDDATVTFTY